MDRCPRHGSPARKTYDFGRYHDAQVTVFDGCECASSYVGDVAGFGGTARHHTTYGEAESHARFAVADKSARYG